MLDILSNGMECIMVYNYGIKYDYFKETWMFSLQNAHAHPQCVHASTADISTYSYKHKQQSQQRCASIIMQTE
jgi:hypothetical protein